MTMDDVTTTPAHARPRAEGLIAAWLCLVIAGATTATFNIWNAVFSSMALVPGILEGVAPVALAMIVSHLVAVYRGGRFLQAVTFAVMLGAMALSVRATGAVVRPAAGDLWWLYGAVIDTAALVALRVLLSLKSRAAQSERDRAAGAAAAADERAVLRAQLAAQQEALEAAQDAQRAAQDRAAEAERAAVQAAQKAEVLARKLEAAKPKRPRRAPAQDRAAAPRSTRAEARATEVPDDLDARAEALAILAAEPGISGAQLGPRVGMSKRWGQEFKRDLAAAAPRGQDPEE